MSLREKRSANRLMPSTNGTGLPHDFEPGDAYEGDMLDQAPPPPMKSRFRWRDSAEFLAGDYRAEWLITKALVKNQPGVIAGPSKGMKTTILIDAAVSLATATPFLGEFHIPKRVKTAIVSGESGEFTLKETCLRVLKAKGLTAADVADWLAWEFTLPVFTDLDVMTDFADGLAALGAEVVFIDPTYLALGGKVDAANMFDMGAAFRVVAEVLLAAGTTPVLVHHANRQLVIGEPMELQHLAYTGLEQFVRQFMLINRREKYTNDGTHDLWLRIGGSQGHGGLWSAHIEEGLVDENFAGREWNVTLETAAESAANRGRQKDTAKRELAREKARADQNEFMLALDAEVASGQAAISTTRLKEKTGFSSTKVADVAKALIEAGLIVAVNFEKTVGNGAKRKVDGFKRVDE